MASVYKRVNLYDLCRLCAQNITKNKVKIFQQNGVKNCIQSKIKKCFSINVKEDDLLPKVVCTKCLKLLEICNAFRQQCLHSETMLSSYIKNSKDTEDFKTSGKVYIKDTVRYDPLMEPDVVNSTSNDNNNESNFSTITDLNTPINNSILSKDDHAQLNDPIIKNITIEDICNNTYPVSSQLNNYSIDIFNEAFKKAVQQLPKDLVNKVIVNENGEVINLPLYDQLNVDSPQVIQNLNSAIKSQVKSTKNSANPEGIDSSIENEVLKDNKNNGSLFKNGQNNTSTVIYPVPQYQNDNYAPSNIYSQTSVDIPSSNPTVINVVCSNNNNNNTLENGTTTSSSVSSINEAQSINNINFRPSSMFNHLPPSTTVVKEVKIKKVKASSETPTNTPVKIHACDICPKVFKRREHLYQHMKLHLGFRPFQCRECKKTFVRKEHLVRHTVLHSGERNFSCDICNKSFSRHDNLLKHIRIHNKEPS